jgi:hypothetical protein
MRQARTPKCCFTPTTRTHSPQVKESCLSIGWLFVLTSGHRMALLPTDIVTLSKSLHPSEKNKSVSRGLAGISLTLGVLKKTAYIYL